MMMMMVMMKSLLIMLFTLLLQMATSSTTTVNAQVVHMAEIQQAQAVNKASTAAVAAATTNTNKRSPFLSTTLSTKITFASSPPSSLQPLDDGTTLAAQKSILSEALTHFYTKIFSDQTAYNIKIISVVLFNDHVLSYKNKNGQPVDVITQQQSQHADGGSGGNEHTVSYTTVISGEYTTSTTATATATAIQNQNQVMISNDEFHNMLTHVTSKFQTHLLKYLHDVVSSTSSSSSNSAKNLNLRNVRSVVLDDFERIGSSSTSSTSSSDALEIMGMSMTTSTVHIVSIIAIVISALVFVMLSIATVRYHKKAKQLKAARWRSKEAASMHNNVGSFSEQGQGRASTQPINAMDDYSFDPLGGGDINNNNGMYSMRNSSSNGQMSQYNTSSYRDNIISNNNINNNITNDEEEIAFSSVWPQSAPPTTLFPAPGATATVSASSISYTQELQNLPKQHVFAPPGKIGVAIDVLNGQPVVHKVRSGSPLEKMLQPNDIIMAIDDVDTTCLCAADVTSLMVRRMDRVRKITFVRRA